MLNISRIQILVLIVVWWVLTPLYGANGTNIRFKRLGISDGLSLSSVYSFYQDSKGFMWFSTEDGLNRFDGRHFTIYRENTEDANSIAHKWIEIIYEDNRGTLWFGSRGGLTSFDPVIEKFRQYKSSIPEPFNICNDSILSIHQLSDTQLFVGTNRGVNIIHLDTERSEQYQPEGFPENISIKAIAAIDNENFYIAGAQGLFLLNVKTNKVSKVLFNKPLMVNSLKVQEKFLWIGTSLGLYYLNISESFNAENPKAAEIASSSGIYINRMVTDKFSNIWFSTPHGLYKLDSDYQLNCIIPDEKLTNSLEIIPGIRILKDRNENIWYATSGDGIFRINTSSGHVENFVHNPCDMESLSQDNINCLYEDNNGTIWIGTFGAGISIYSPIAQKFKLIRHDPMQVNTLTSNFVWAILEDSKGRLWIGTNNNGISLYLPNEKRYVHYKHNETNPQSLSNSSVRSIYEDSNGTIWIGTDGGGLNKFKENENTFLHYKHDPNSDRSLTGNSVRTIYEDKDGAIWIGARSGLNRYNKSEDNFTRYQNNPDDSTSLSHNFIYSALYQDSRGDFWVGTYGGGLNKWNSNTGKFEHFQYDPNNANSLSDDIVFSINEDSKGILWIATNSKLNSFDTQTGKFTRFGIKEGLPNEVIYGICPDREGHLWLSTNMGICRFNPITKSLINYDVTDGLQSNEFNGGAFHSGKSGKIYFGGVNGLNVIDPKLVAGQSDNSNIIFARLEILGKEVMVRPNLTSKQKNRVIQDSSFFYISEHISYAKQVALDFSTRHFSLEFIDFGNMLNTNINYAYKMVGLEENWHYSGNRNYVSYANMPKGKYTFMVKAQLTDGSWSKNISEIDIEIIPPFWRTRWFYLLELASFLFITWRVYRYLFKLRTYRVLKEQNEQINLANKKLQESEQFLKVNNATKDKFFSIISHDLKNPFTSLLSISEVLNNGYDTYAEEDKKESVSKMHSSIRQIYSLLENLLTWSRAQTDKLEYNPVPFNISKLLQENINLFDLPASKKNISIVSLFEKDVKIFADREMINTTIRNLLNNAIKFSPDGSKVEVGIIKSIDEIKVFVKDEGLGIAPEDQDLLFRIDKKLKKTGTAGEKGTGLGLILCKEFVEKNNGVLTLSSEEGRGSKFYFTLPI